MGHSAGWWREVGKALEEGMEAGREQDRYLPIANISRIMKRALPANAKIAKDSKETMQECVSEFISFITSECAPCACAAAPRPAADAASPRWLSGRATSASEKSEKPSTAMTCCGR